MVFLTGRNTERSPREKWLRRVIGLLAVTAIAFALYQIPYDILREERLRLYGETHTMGLVTEVRSNAIDPADSRFVIRYKYVDRDGFAREADAPVPKEVWQQLSPGDRVEVLYVNSRPQLSRIPDEIEPAFQTTLRSLLN